MMCGSMIIKNYKNAKRMKKENEKRYKIQDDDYEE